MVVFARDLDKALTGLVKDVDKVVKSSKKGVGFVVHMDENEKSSAEKLKELAKANKIISLRTGSGRPVRRTRKSSRWPSGDNIAGRISGAYWPKWSSVNGARWARYYDGKACTRPC